MVYLDNAATTAMSEVALSSLMEVSTLYMEILLQYIASEGRRKDFLKDQEKSLLTVLELSRRKYISHHAEQKVITGL